MGIDELRDLARLYQVARCGRRSGSLGSVRSDIEFIVSSDEGTKAANLLAATRTLSDGLRASQ